MCGRRSDSTIRPAFLPDRRAHSVAEPAAQITDPADPAAGAYGFRVTEEGLRALEEYEQRHGKPVLRKVPLPDTVAEALADEAWRDRRHHYRREARARGNRLVTITGRHRNGRKVPELRIIAQWLEQAGFTYGRHCEVEVTPGTLTIRAV